MDHRDSQSAHSGDKYDGIDIDGANHGDGDDEKQADLSEGIKLDNAHLGDASNLDNDEDAARNDGGGDFAGNDDYDHFGDDYEEGVYR